MAMSNNLSRKIEYVPNLLTGKNLFGEFDLSLLSITRIFVMSLIHMLIARTLSAFWFFLSRDLSILPVVCG